MLTCSTDRPWGVHVVVRSDEDCPRCGWTAPGPKGDALADAVEAAAEARAWAAEYGCIAGDGEPDLRRAA
jgi:hypothetical protein